MARIKIVTAIWGDKYDESYVRALTRQVPGLVVLREHDGLYQPDHYRKWFCKIEVFRPENRHLRPCLFIDLDTLITGSLDPILSLDPSRLWLIADFYRPERAESGLFIAPEGKSADEIWQRSTEVNLQTNYQGDGYFLSTFPYWRITDMVDGIYSYKVDKLKDTGPRDARVVCFHGHPKPHNCGGWAQERFERLSKPL